MRLSTFKSNPKCHYIIKVLLSACILISTLGSALAEAQTNTEEIELKKIVPALRISDGITQEYMGAILTTYQVLNSGSVSDVNGRVVSRRFNFIFSAGEGYISGRRVTRDAIYMLTPEAQEKVLNTPTETDECYIQTFDFSNAGRLFLTVHNDSYDNPERVYQCFAVALWYFTYEDLEGVDAADWRKSIGDIFATLIERR
ncbi:hypothetical protein [Litoreibacter roseus]|uniref:Uncharacterized protein n=1 Tax=Litoreibacter roseus TaxID=2601869 RepID=A0A6N6JCS9_9RHOB|nr:hypothetical protein [Litoreibacter roseus]GFE63002.1 hypothetical protein KIN_00760 [Litoreibacter roseus]